jgi:hypothetical protein
MDADAMVRSPAHSRLAPQVQRCPQKNWVKRTAQGNETKAGQVVLGLER